MHVPKRNKGRFRKLRSLIFLYKSKNRNVTCCEPLEAYDQIETTGRSKFGDRKHFEKQLTGLYRISNKISLESSAAIFLTSKRTNLISD